MQLLNGSSAIREYMNHHEAAVVFSFVDKENIVLAKQCSYAIGKVTYEIPADKIDVGETPVKCITRELKRRNRIYSQKFELLLSFYSTVALPNELLHIFFAF
ncbi:MAG: NUDIX hydrolase [Endomicrobium sp.]|nr:NUDIX hydrolase [Endomicrobium sp.]